MIDQVNPVKAHPARASDSMQLTKDRKHVVSSDMLEDRHAERDVERRIRFRHGPRRFAQIEGQSIGVRLDAVAVRNGNEPRGRPIKGQPRFPGPARQKPIECSVADEFVGVDLHIDHPLRSQGQQEHAQPTLAARSDLQERCSPDPIVTQELATHLKPVQGGTNGCVQIHGFPPVPKATKPIPQRGEARQPVQGHVPCLQSHRSEISR